MLLYKKRKKFYISSWKKWAYPVKAGGAKLKGLPSDTENDSQLQCLRIERCLGGLL